MSFENFHAEQRLQWGDLRIKVVVLHSREIEVGSLALLVPRGREDDWIFTTEAGRKQLLESSGVARLTLLAREKPSPSLRIHEDSCPQVWERDEEDDSRDEQLKQQLMPRLLALFGSEIEFACYEDEVVWRRVIDRAESPLTGSMIVEDVRLRNNSLRRWLRFKSMPNLIQTEVPLEAGEGETLELLHDTLVHVYLAPLVAGLSLVSHKLSGKVLCVGVGGGALPMFLSRRFDSLQIEAVEIDEVVLEVAKRDFGLVECERLKLRVENGLSAVEKASAGDGFQAILVDVSTGDGSSCPPQAFLDNKFLMAARSALHAGGLLAINVMPRGGIFHQEVLRELAGVFEEVYEIEVSEGENYAVFALPSPCLHSELVMTTVGSIVEAQLISSIRRVV